MNVSTTTAAYPEVVDIEEALGVGVNVLEQALQILLMCTSWVLSFPLP